MATTTPCSKHVPKLNSEKGKKNQHHPEDSNVSRWSVSSVSREVSEVTAYVATCSNLSLPPALEPVLIFVLPFSSTLRILFCIIPLQMLVQNKTKTAEKKTIT